MLFGENKSILLTLFPIDDIIKMLCDICNKKVPFLFWKKDFFYYIFMVF